MQEKPRRRTPAVSPPSGASWEPERAASQSTSPQSFCRATRRGDWRSGVSVENATGAKEDARWASPLCLQPAPVKVWKRGAIKLLLRPVVSPPSCSLLYAGSCRHATHRSQALPPRRGCPHWDSACAICVLEASGRVAERQCLCERALTWQTMPGHGRTRRGQHGEAFPAERCCAHTQSAGATMLEVFLQRRGAGAGHKAAADGLRRSAALNRRALR